MSFKNMSVSMRVRNIITVIVVVLLIAALVTAIAVLSNPRQTPTKGEMSGVDIEKVDIMYSPETVKQFNIYITRYLTNLFKSLEIQWPSNGGIADLILKGCAAARLPADKALAFGAYLASAEVDELFKNIILEYFIITGEGEDAVIEFNPDVDVLDIMIKYANPVKAINDIINNTVITPSEAGRVIYYILMSLVDENAAKIIKEIGEESFSSLLLDGMQIADLLQAFQGGQEISRFEARIVREMLYEVGNQYNVLLQKFGKDAIEDLFSTTFISSTEDTKIFMEYVNLMFKDLRGVPTYLLSMAATVLTTFNAVTFDAIADYSKDRDIKQLQFAKTNAMVTLAKAHNTVIGDLSETDLINKCAKMSAVLDIMGEIKKDEAPDMVAIDALTSRYITKYKALLASLKNFGANYDTLNNYNKFTSLSEQELALLITQLDSLTLSMKDFSSGINRLSSLLLYNALYTLLANSSQPPEGING